MQAILIMLPILAYGFITAVAVIYVLAVALPRRRGRRGKRVDRTAARRH